MRGGSLSFLTGLLCVEGGEWVLCIGAGQHQFVSGQKPCGEVVRRSRLDVIPHGCLDTLEWTEAKRQRAPLGAPPMPQCELCAG